MSITPKHVALINLTIPDQNVWPHEAMTLDV